MKTTTETTATTATKEPIEWPELTTKTKIAETDRLSESVEWEQRNQRLWG